VPIPKIKEMERSLVHLATKLHFEEEIGHLSESEQFKKLADYIDNLVQTNFNKLLSILYQIDVPEERVKTALANNEGRQNAGFIIARLLVEREIEKIEFRKK
jgi:hypothetical protein